jgi:hypothetical protein
MNGGWRDYAQVWEGPKETGIRPEADLGHSSAA